MTIRRVSLSSWFYFALLKVQLIIDPAGTFPEGKAWLTGKVRDQTYTAEFRIPLTTGCKPETFSKI